MAHKKAGGSSRNGRDTAGKRLGVKKFGGERRDPGQHPDPPARHQVAPRRNVGMGRDYTDLRDDRGHVKFHERSGRVYVSVEPRPPPPPAGGQAAEWPPPVALGLPQRPDPPAMRFLDSAKI